MFSTDSWIFYLVLSCRMLNIWRLVIVFNVWISYIFLSSLLEYYDRLLPHVCDLLSSFSNNFEENVWLFSEYIIICLPFCWIITFYWIIHGSMNNLPIYANVAMKVSSAQGKLNIVRKHTCHYVYTFLSFVCRIYKHFVINEPLQIIIILCACAKYLS